ncbi:hypothetical protein TSAR_014496 [Trichomalopsis sarcophagae]|uniref:MAM domain-containing protein n=1 Tax=Trichomalopsis sarcophagae TaxID=543379 RepID=A0A232F882_9HYME|nr:hypothetical protein TSAR_014496 [Trichomalopsis sarcophagae]
MGRMNTATMRCIAVLVFLVIALCAASPRSSPSDSPQCPTPRLKNGRIRARGRGRIIRYSCYTDYELVGNKYSTCIRGSWDTPTPICVSTRCPAIPAPKHAVVGEKYHGAILMYFCEPGYVLVGNAEIYCDGRQWNGTTPYCRDSNATAPTSCDFEKDGLCWWEQDPKHNFDWIRHRFDTPSSHIGTGPTHDHTLGAGNDGYYLYIEASGRLVNDTARILSPLYNASLTESGCFSFWYHMYGTTIGSLNVYLKPEVEETPKLMWTKSGNQGNQWLRGLFELPTLNSSFQIIMEGIRGSSYVSDIAIDDIAILQGDECNVKNLTVSPPASDGDEVEVFNAMQSCQNRCVNGLAETTPSSELYSNPDVCQCTLDCAENSSCCPDFAEYCIYEVTEQAETLVPSTNDTIAVVPTNPTTEKQTEKGQPSATMSTAPSTTTTMSTSVKSTKITESTIPFSTDRPRTTLNETSVETRATTAPPTRAVYSSAASTMSVHVETPFVSRVHETSTTPTTTTTTSTTRTTIAPSTTTTKASTEPTDDDAQVQTEPQHVLAESSRQQSTFGLSGIIVIVIGILTGVTITTVVALVFLRRRRRGSNKSAFSEDSDVRFLTSDEVLDFNLAKPAGEYDEL